MATGSRSRARGGGAAAIVALMVMAAQWPAPARAESSLLQLHLRAGAALFLTAPQTRLFGPGADVALAAEIAPSPYVGLVLGAGYLDFAGSGDPRGTNAIRAGGGVRVRPLNDDKGYRFHLGSGRGHQGNLFGNLWLGAEAFWFRTADLNRLAIEGAVGTELSLADGLQLGPYLAFQHVFQDGAASDPKDANMLMLGLTVTIAGGIVHRPDADGDGITDADDQCPGEPETVNAYNDDDGCPDVAPLQQYAAPPAPASPPPAPAEVKPAPVEEKPAPVTPAPAEVKPAPAEVKPAPIDEKPPAPTAAAPAVDAEIRGDRIEFARPAVEFVADDFKLTPQLNAVMAKVAALLNEHKEIRKVRIVAHTREPGTPAHNRKLNRLRADEVRGTLLDLKVSPKRLTIEPPDGAADPGTPAAANPAAPGQPADQHVELQIIDIAK